ncbi:MAG: glycerate kinase [Clostridia bacterium]|nr:glycerate kinase [Clostridia bacterium]
MKKVVIAIDSFKGSLSTFGAGTAIEEGIRQVYPNAEVIISPIADGGEGTVEAVVSATGGEFVTCSVCGPLGNRIAASYGFISQTKTAVIEMSQAAGITLISDAERNPLHTTTFGVGELILDAISKGCRNFVIGIGGSATNDGGVGMLQALGFEFLNKDGKQVSYGAKGLQEIVAIKTENAVKELKECQFSVACDVKNVLCGENGCSAVYGPQKGATPEMILEMDSWLKDYARLTKEVLPASDENFPGTGAAGGMGFALLSYLDATLCSGIELVIRETGLERHIPDADVVITGEGRLDGQSYMGKAPIGVAKLAKKYGKTVLAFSGCVTDDAVLCNEHGIDAFFPIVRKPCTLEEAMDVENAHKNLRDTVCQVFRLLNVYDNRSIN